MSTADVGAGRLALVEGDDLAVRSDVGGVVAVRGRDLDVVVLADVARVRDGLRLALSGLGGADESRRGATDRGSEESGSEGEERKELHSAREKAVKTGRRVKGGGVNIES